MTSVNQLKLLVVVIVALYKCNLVQNNNFDITRLCKDVAQAVNWLYRSLPEEMPLEERCKRYAVLLSMARTRGVTNQLALLQMLEMPERELNMLYESMSIQELASRYFITIDVYRTTHLEPAFLDIIECLKRINSDDVKLHLKDPELITIVNLYKQSIGSPATVINLNETDLSGFHPAFKTALINLFGGNFEDVVKTPTDVAQDLLSDSSHPRMDQRYSEQKEERLNVSPQLRYRERNLIRVRERDRIWHRRQRTYSRLQRQAIEKESTIGHKWPHGFVDQLLDKFEWRRYLGRERQRRYRERNMELVRARSRESERRRRRRKKEQENQSSLPPNVNPDDPPS